jgi:hypothetical protein
MAKVKGKAAGAAKVKTPRKPRVAAETFLPGMEPPRIKEIDDAATYYYEVMMDRVEKSKEEDEAKTQLIEKMAKNNLERYKTSDGLVVREQVEREV